jgi:hypothetical protein
MIKPQDVKSNTESHVTYSILLGANLSWIHCPWDNAFVFYSWYHWLIRMQEHRGTHFRQVVLLWIQTVGTTWYDKQLVKWSASCYSQFNPYKRDPLHSCTVTYMGDKDSPHVAKRKKHFGLPRIKPWPLGWHATTVLAKPFCNWLVCTKIKLTLEMLVWTRTIKFDHALGQCAQFKQFRQTIYERQHVGTGSSWLKLPCQYNCTPLSNWCRWGMCSWTQTAVFITNHT